MSAKLHCSEHGGGATRSASSDGLPYVQTVPSSPQFESEPDSRADTEIGIEAKRLRAVTQTQKASSQALAADLDASKSKVRELDQEILRLKVQLAAKESENSTLREELAETKRLLEAEARQKADLSQAYEDLEKHVYDLREDVSYLDASNATTEGLNLSLQDQIKEGQAREKERSARHAVAIEALLAQVRELSHETSSVTAVVSAQLQSLARETMMATAKELACGRSHPNEAGDIERSGGRHSDDSPTGAHNGMRRQHSHCISPQIDTGL